MTQHAKLSPSAASRWLTCTAAPALESTYEETTSEYAKEGTFAHALAELETAFALGQITKSAHTRKLNQLKKDDWYSQEMADYVDEYVYYIKELFLKLEEEGKEPVCDLEVKLDLSGYVPEGFGTADCVIIADGQLNIIDFKYGKGVKVEAFNNPQMKLYALGAYELYSVLYDIEEVKTIIIQPRLGGVSEAELSAQELIKWGLDEVRPKAKQAYEGTGEFKPSEDACRFCKAAGDCRARAEYFVKLFDETEPAEKLSKDEAGKILLMAKDMENWLKALKEKVTSDLLDGETVEGWKLVEGRSIRKYTDEGRVASALIESGLSEEEVYTKKVIGISSVEKMLGKKKAAEILGDLVFKPEGAPVIAETTDKRPEISVREKTIKSFDEE